MPSAPPEPRPALPSAAADRRLWEYRWVRDLALLIVLAGMAYLAYSLRAVTLPVLISLGLAYAFNPLVTWAQRRLKLPRVLSTLLVMLTAALVLTALVWYLAPKVTAQVVELKHALPGYSERLDHALQRLLSGLRPASAGSLPATAPAAPAPATQPGPGAGDAAPLMSLGTIADYILSHWLGILTVVGAAIGLVAYLIVAGALMVFCFFNFSWKFDRILAWFDPFIPPAHRTRTLHVLGRMDRAVSAFIRGRLLQATIVAIILSTGWTLAGVPYGLLLGLICGVLNLIPYAGVVGWPTAILLTWLDQSSGGGGAALNLWRIVFWPSAVYGLAVFTDGWIVEPQVQGRATNLDPLTVLLAVLTGGALLGILGLMLAVPTAACLKILAQEVVLPRIRSYVRGDEGPRAEGQGPRGG